MLSREDGRLLAIRRADNRTWELPGAERMSEVYAIRLLNALDEHGSHVRHHDGRRLIREQ
ncbi:hypothetical protein [Streptomyces sp.]|uniref:hypothetical protein n=1 Tax=Streptomyces sp. TaxID=1931 RepID=UPI002D792B36|nr:hypothetical protein [Streptomyces sp.]HET6360213.1 hypothetical protein [Streptomyces sp.]